MKNRKNLKLAKIFHWKINKSIKMADKRMPTIKQSLLKTLWKPFLDMQGQLSISSKESRYKGIHGQVPICKINFPLTPLHSCRSSHLANMLKLFSFARLISDFSQVLQRGLAYHLDPLGLVPAFYNNQNCLIVQMTKKSIGSTSLPFQFQ